MLSSREAVSYDDVPRLSWFTKYAGFARIFNLFPNRTTLLLPDKPLTRSDVAVAMYQLLASRVAE
jgi:hypothetical protein